MIYFDNAASEPLSKEAKRMLKRLMKCHIGNPSSLHNYGLFAHVLIEKSRNVIAELLHCKPTEIIFTSGASESNSMICYSAPKFTTDGTNHDSIELGKKDTSTKKKEWKLITLVNNETGLDKLDELLMMKPYDNDWVHVDATQYVGKHSIDLSKYKQITSMSFSGHKFGALPGTGVLFVREDKQKLLSPIIYGTQEKYLRGGTENIFGIVSMAMALMECYTHMDEWSKHVNKIGEYLKAKITNRKVTYNNGILNITFDYVTSELAVKVLNDRGICVSSGSACRSGQDTPSQSFIAAGLDEGEALRTIRVSFSHHNTLLEAKIFYHKLMKFIDDYDTI